MTNVKRFMAVLIFSLLVTGTLSCRAVSAEQTETGNACVEYADEQILFEETVGDSAHPVIALTDVPSYGEIRPMQGMVYMEDGSDFDSSAYRISLFLQLEEGWTYYVKPTYATPYVELSGDGSFTGKFITGGRDDIAKVLHVMLIPSDYTPGSFSDTRAAAFDYVKINRAEDGNVTVDPARSAPELPDIQPAIDALLPVSGNKIAVDVGFYTDGSQPGSALSEDLIRRQLEAVSTFSDTVRFYSSGGELSKAYQIANSMGFSVVGTAWLSGDAQADLAEMDALIANCNSGYVQVACVGNETLLRGDLTPEELVEDIRYVRENLADSAIPVTTSDSVDLLLDHASVRNACNLIMPNCYPYWGGCSISDAADAFIASVTNLKAASGGKQILVSETGWPTAGQTIGEAVPGEQEAARYFDEIRNWSLASGTQIFWFDAADEPWKAANEGETGAHWGILTRDFEIKDGYAQTEFFTANPYDYSIAVDLSGAVITGLTDKTYTGRAITQTPVVTVGETSLTEGTDYTVAYFDNINAGTARVTITGIGSYEGTAEAFFKIGKASQKITVKSSAGSVSVGRSVTVSITGAEGKKSYKSSNTGIATVTSSGKVTAKKVGTVKITASSGATENYGAASKSVTIKVLPAAATLLKAENMATGVKLSWNRVAGATGYIVYRGNTRAATVTKGTTVNYVDKKANTNGTKYTFKVVATAATGTSKLSKSVTTYRVSQPSIGSVKNGSSGKMTVKWGRNSKATGYTIQYSTDRTFANGVKSVKIKKPGTTSVTVGSLKKGRTYYVRVRTYKTVGSVSYWSKWSTTKSVRITK